MGGRSSRKVVRVAAKKAAKKPVAAKKAPPKKTAKKAAGKPAAPKIEGKKVGVVTHWYGHISVAIIKLSAPLKVGDKVKIARGEHVADESIASMQLEHEQIQAAKKGQEIGVKVKEHAHEGAEVYVV